MTPASANPATTTRAGRSWRWRGVVLAVAVIAGAAGWLGWQWWENRREADAALRAARNGRFADAEAGLQTVFARDPNRLEVIQALARGLLASDRFDEAEPFLARWAELRPGDAEPDRLVLFGLHRTALQYRAGAIRQSLQQRALAAGQRVLERDAEDAAAAQEVLWLCLALGRFDEADRVGRACRARRPDDPWLLYLQARVCHARGDVGQARTLLDTLQRVQPQFPRGLLLRGILHYEANEPDRAIPLLRQVIAQDPAHEHEAGYYLGLALARAGHAEEARQVMAGVQWGNLEHAVAGIRQADSPAVRVWRADLLLSAGDADAALPLLHAVLREDPTNAAAHRLLAVYYEQRGDTQKASEHRRRDPVTR